MNENLQAALEELLPKLPVVAEDEDPELVVEELSETELSQSFENIVAFFVQAGVPRAAEILREYVWRLG
ncbi:MAG: hypothetical protein GW947_04505 [Candidatus Pacebacteria bacterium]|nr:hypothetical protein [Candidatus Paceibacterota bacterium]